MATRKNYVKDRTKYANSNNQYKRHKSQAVRMSKSELDERFIEWVTFYRRNLHRFAEHYFGFKLFWYQKVLLYLMGISTLINVVACRAAAKSYIIAIYACCICVLKPGSRVVIASATKKQASLIVAEKIKKELMPNSLNLRREIKDIKTSANETEVFFHNSSSIVVVPATDNARGQRVKVAPYVEKFA